MSNENDTSILSFPSPNNETGELKTDVELIQSVRLSAVRLLNLKAAGKYELTFENIKHIRIVNKICLKLGYPPIVDDISQL